MFSGFYIAVFFLGNIIGRIQVLCLFFFQIDLDAAHFIDHFFKSVKIYDTVFIDLNSKVFRNSLIKQFHAAICVCRIQLIPSVSRDLYIDIPHNGGKLQFFCLKIDRRDHRRVGPSGRFFVGSPVRTHQQNIYNILIKLYITDIYTS